MNNFWFGFCIASSVWGACFIVFVDWNFNQMRKMWFLTNSLKDGTDGVIDMLRQQIANTEAVRDAWKAEAEKYKAMLGAPR